MKEGDIVEWRGVNKVCTGRIVKRENGEFVAYTDQTHFFPLKDIRFSKSFKLIEK